MNSPQKDQDMGNERPSDKPRDVEMVQGIENGESGDKVCQSGP